MKTLKELAQEMDKAQNKDVLEQMGWTSAEFDLMKTAPRSQNAQFLNGKFTNPKVEGCKILYCVWNAEEKAAYKEYKAHLDGNKGTGTTRVKSSNGAKFTAEDIAEAMTALNEVKDLGASPELIAKLMKVLPHESDQEMNLLLGVENTFALTANAKPFCNLKWVLNRNADDSFLENHFPTIEDLSDGWENDEIAQVHKKQEVVALARRLYSEKQIDLNEYIEGLNAQYENC